MIANSQKFFKAANSILAGAGIVKDQDVDTQCPHEMFADRMAATYPCDTPGNVIKSAAALELWRQSDEFCGQHVKYATVKSAINSYASIRDVQHQVAEAVSLIASNAAKAAVKIAEAAVTEAVSYIDLSTPDSVVKSANSFLALASDHPSPSRKTIATSLLAAASDSNVAFESPVTEKLTKIARQSLPSISGMRSEVSVREDDARRHNMTDALTQLSCGVDRMEEAIKLGSLDEACEIASDFVDTVDMMDTVCLSIKRASSRIPELGVFNYTADLPRLLNSCLTMLGDTYLAVDIKKANFNPLMFHDELVVESIKQASTINDVAAVIDEAVLSGKISKASVMTVLRTQRINPIGVYDLVKELTA